MIFRASVCRQNNSPELLEKILKVLTRSAGRPFAITVITALGLAAARAIKLASYVIRCMRPARSTSALMHASDTRGSNPSCNRPLSVNQKCNTVPLPAFSPRFTWF